VRSDPALAGVFARHATGELQAALAAQPAGRALLAELQDFLNRYGHREMVFSTVLEPTWKDAPELVLGIIKGFAGTAPRDTGGPPAWELARDELLAHAWLRRPAPRGAVRGCPRRRAVWRVREDTHFDATLMMPILQCLWPWGNASSA
jgi:pyruvate,water dikinase